MQSWGEGEVRSRGSGRGRDVQQTRGIAAGELPVEVVPQGMAEPLNLYLRSLDSRSARALPAHELAALARSSMKLPAADGSSCLDGTFSHGENTLCSPQPLCLSFPLHSFIFLPCPLPPLVHCRSPWANLMELREQTFCLSLDCC